MLLGFENKKFGVEVEFGTALLSEVETTMQRELQGTGIAVHREGYNHQTRRYWKIVTDASVSENINYRTYDGNGGELVSPVLQGQAGLDELETVLNALNAHPDVKINVKCGLHLHLSWANCTPAQIKNIVRRYATFENDFDSMMPRSRRNSRWCANISRNRSFLTSVESYTGSNIRGMANCGGSDRYRKVNLVPLRTYGSIEFRQHSGTTDFEKIKNWALLMSDFCDASQNAPATNFDFSAYRRSDGRLFGEVRELFEARGWTVEKRGRGASLAFIFKNEQGEIAAHKTTAQMKEMYQRKRVLNSNFSDFYARMFGLSSDAWLRGVREDVARYVTGRVATLSSSSQFAAAA